MKLSFDKKKRFAEMVVLKLMDLEEDDGGLNIPVVVPSDLAPIDELLTELAVADKIAIPRKGDCYELTDKGEAELDRLISEAEAIIDEYGDRDTEAALRAMEKQNLDPLRGRFVWGWFEGEFDDLVEFQERRGVDTVEPLWAYYLMSDAFYEELARDLPRARFN